MPFDIVIGRTKKDVDKYGTRGSIYLGKQYVQMGATTSLSNSVYLDVAKSHVVFVCGKRGGGKSYTMGVIAEGVASLDEDVKQNLSIVMLDTMGVYWTMKYPNHQSPDLLKEWGIEGQGLDVKIFTPSGFYNQYREKGIPSDAAFSLQPADLRPEDWCTTFSLDINSAEGVLIERVLHSLEGSFEIEDVINAVLKEEKSEEHTKNVVENQFRRVEDWGIFSKEGTPLSELAVAGQVTILDVSPYATLPNGWSIKSLVVGLISNKLFTDRMLARKDEEFKTIDSSVHYFSKDVQKNLDAPLVWLVIDEAHELLPKEGKTTATDPLVTILREGRQPGISLILASQQPGKIHTDVMTQSDIVISHRLTAQVDVDALGQLMQSYMRDGLSQKLEGLPSIKGSAIVFDDKNERIFPIQIRPRITWHGGSAPTAMVEKKELF